jgi:hypothetical protein
MGDESEIPNDTFMPMPQSHPSDPKRLILCMKWGTMYGPQHVNALKRGVARHLSYPHRFICLTDDPKGLDEGIEVFPIPQLQLPEGNADRRWTKLGILARDVYGLEGSALFLDLDLIVVAGLEPFFDYPGNVVMIRDMDLFRPKPLRALNPKRKQFLDLVGNSSVFRMEMGAHSDVLDAFVRDPVQAQEQFKISQQFMSHQLMQKSALSYWPSTWCVSFKNHCVPRHFKSYFKNPVIPEGARIVVFAGSPKMDEVLSGGGHKWYRRIGDVKFLTQFE